jgi:hypothetical protein
MAAERATKGGRGAELKEAAQWLSTQLADGPVAEQELEPRAKAAGLKWPTVKRAKKELKVKSRKKGFGPGAPWHWELPAPPGEKEAEIPDADELAPYGQNGPYDTPKEDKEAIGGQYGNTPTADIQDIEDNYTDLVKVALYGTRPAWTELTGCGPRPRMNKSRGQHEQQA